MCNFLMAVWQPKQPNEPRAISHFPFIAVLDSPMSQTHPASAAPHSVVGGGKMASQSPTPTNEVRQRPIYHPLLFITKASGAADREG